MFTIGIGFIVTTFLSGVAGGVGHVINGTVAYIGTVLVSLVLNVGVFWLGFRLATAFQVRWRDVRAGAVIAAVCWQVLQLAGGLVVGHLLRRSSELYGTFGIVLGLLAWLYLEAEVTLYAAEVDVVLARHLWPRSIMPPEPAAPAEAAGPGEPAQAGESPEAAPRSVRPRRFQCPPPGQPPNATGMMRTGRPAGFPGHGGPSAGARQRRRRGSADD